MNVGGKLEAVSLVFSCSCIRSAVRVEACECGRWPCRPSLSSRWIVSFSAASLDFVGRLFFHCNKRKRDGEIFTDMAGWSAGGDGDTIKHESKASFLLV